jgi:broad specificity phosphatase PhoE
MSTFLLLRHAAHDWLAKGIAGRLPGVSLNAQGREQARAVAAWLATAGVDAIYSSPQARALETVAPLAERLGLPALVSDSFDEIDFGRWMGQSFEQLARDPDWDGWVNRRGSATPPGGEPFAGVQRRALDGLERLAIAHPGQRVLVASHGDVIKAVLASFLGSSLDQLERFEIAPASVSVVATGPGWSKVHLVNGAAAVRLP